MVTNPVFYERRRGHLSHETCVRMGLEDFESTNNGVEVDKSGIEPENGKDITMQSAGFDLSREIVENTTQPVSSYPRYGSDEWIMAIDQNATGSSDHDDMRMQENQREGVDKVVNESTENESQENEKQRTESSHDDILNSEQQVEEHEQSEEDVGEDELVEPSEEDDDDARSNTHTLRKSNREKKPSRSLIESNETNQILQKMEQPNRTKKRQLDSEDDEDIRPVQKQRTRRVTKQRNIEKERIVDSERTTKPEKKWDTDSKVIS